MMPPSSNPPAKSLDGNGLSVAPLPSQRYLLRPIQVQIRSAPNVFCLEDVTGEAEMERKQGGNVSLVNA